MNVLSDAEIASVIASSISARTPSPFNLNRRYLDNCKGATSEEVLARVAVYAALLRDGAAMTSFPIQAIDCILGAANTVTGPLPKSVDNTDDAIKHGLSQPPQSAWYENMLAISNTWCLFRAAGNEIMGRFISDVCPINQFGCVPQETAMLAIACHKAGVFSEETDPSRFASAFTKAIHKTRSAKISCSESMLAVFNESIPKQSNKTLNESQQMRWGSPNIAAARRARALETKPEAAPYFAVAKSIAAKAGMFTKEKPLRAEIEEEVAKEAFLGAAATPYYYSPVNIQLTDSDGQPTRRKEREVETEATAVFDFFGDVVGRQHVATTMQACLKNIIKQGKGHVRRSGEVAFAENYVVANGVSPEMAIAVKFAKNLANRKMGRTEAIVALMTEAGKRSKTSVREACERRGLPVSQLDINATINFDDPTSRRNGKTALTWVYRNARENGDIAVANVIARVASVPLDRQDDDKTFFETCKEVCRKYGKRGQTAATALHTCRSIIMGNQYAGSEYLNAADNNKVSAMLLARADAAKTYPERLKRTETEGIILIGKTLDAGAPKRTRASIDSCLK